MRAETGHRSALFVTVILATLWGVANFTDIPHLWGLRFAPYLPDWWLIVSAVLIGISFVPAVARWAMRLIVMGTAWLEESRGRRVAVLTVVGAALVGVWIEGRVATWFLGDGNLRLNQIVAGGFFLPTEPGDFFLHAVVYQYIVEPVGLGVSWGYHVISALSGLLYLAGAYRLTRYLYPRQWGFALALFMSSGLTVLFFGYVESYSILAGLLPWVMLAAVRAIDGTGGKGSLVLLVLVGGILHPVALVLFGGALAYVTVGPIVTRQTKWRIWVVPAVVGGLAVVGAYGARAFGVSAIGDYILPLLPNDEINQGFFTATHGWEVLNWLLGAALPLIVLAVAMNGGQKKVTDAARRGLTLWMTLTPLLFLLCFRPQLGGPRDWDLFGLAAFVALGAWVIPPEREGRRLPWAVVPVSVLGLVVVASFAVVNGSVVRSTDRFVDLIEHARYKNLFKEYKMLYTFAALNEELEGRREEFARTAWAEPPYTHEDSLFILDKLALHRIEAGDSRSARQYLDVALAADSGDVNVYLTLIRYYREFGQEEDLRGVAADLERKLAGSALGRMNAGVLYMQLEEPEAGARNLEAAFALDSANTMVQLNYATAMYQAGRYERSAELLRRVIAVDGSLFLAHYYLAASSHRLGDMVSARAALTLADKAAQTQSEHRMVSALAQRLDRER